MDEDGLNEARQAIIRAAADVRYAQQEVKSHRFQAETYTNLANEHERILAEHVATYTAALEALVQVEVDHGVLHYPGLNDVQEQLKMEFPRKDSNMEFLKWADRQMAIERMVEENQADALAIRSPMDCVDFLEKHAPDMMKAAQAKCEAKAEVEALRTRAEQDFTLHPYEGGDVDWVAVRRDEEARRDRELGQ